MDTQSTQYASILCIGDELLDGRVSDKNIAPLSRVCAAHNIAVQQAMFTRDDRGSLMTALQWLQRQKPSWVLITGGLGPTEDDRTREEAAAFFDAPLEHDAKAMEIIEARFKARQKQVTENNLKQAMFPRGATIIYSEVGTASGFMITKESTSYIFMPGVPREVAWFCEQRLGDIINQSKEQVKAQSTHTFYITGIGESGCETRLLPLPSTLHDQVKLSWRANDPLIELSVTAPDTLMETLTHHIYSTLDSYVLSQDALPFEALGKKLLEQGAEVTTAESCTGGLVAGAITAIPGSSGWFKRSFVTYSNESKQALVGVKQDTLESYGAVSTHTVAQMSRGANKAAGSTHAIAISGIAGPSGGSEEKPVGTVYFGLDTPHGTYTHRAHLVGLDRERVRLRSVYIAARLLLWSLNASKAREEQIEELGLSPYTIEE